MTKPETLYEIFAEEAVESERATMETAKLFISEIQEALDAGTKHYNKAGDPLTDVRAVLQTLKSEGAILFEDPHQ